MSFEAYFPVWSKLTTAQQDVIRGCISRRSAKKGTILHNGSGDCSGILLITSGQLRAYITSEEGREITVYRLFEQDVCLFSAPCMMPSLQFELTIVTEKDTDFWLIPPSAYKALMTESAPLANYTNEIMASRVSEIMWLVEQVMWKSMDKRVADFLLEESNIEETDLLQITHETIANHLGTHREVVTRMLKYLQNEGAVKLTRGAIEIIDKSIMEAL